MSRQIFKWILLAPALALLLLGHGFGESWVVTPGQPAQMSSRVHYDPKLTDPFFKSNEWTDPNYGLEPIPRDKRTKVPPRVKQTAKCLSTSFGEEHLVRFCKATLLDVNTINLIIVEHDPSFDDVLEIKIRNGMFTCQYSTSYKGGPTEGLIWSTTRQKLTLDKKAYRKGDLIKGRIDFECLQEHTDPKVLQKYGKWPKIIAVKGVFKTIAE